MRDHLLFNNAQLGAGHELSKRSTAVVEKAHEVIKVTFTSTMLITGFPYWVVMLDLCIACEQHPLASMPHVTHHRLIESPIESPCQPAKFCLMRHAYQLLTGQLLESSELSTGILSSSISNVMPCGSQTCMSVGHTA